MSVLTGRRKPGDAWLPEDTLAAKAWQRYQDELCPGCGQPKHVSLDPGAEGGYVAPPPVRCHACTALGLAQRTFDQANKAANYRPPPGLLWSVERR